MKVEVLHIEGCASWKAAGARLRQALDAAGHPDVPVEVVIIRTGSDAARSGFAGSPTILVDGEDLFPSDGRTVDLACRVYATEAGLAAAPTQSQIEEALRVRQEG